MQGKSLAFFIWKFFINIFLNLLTLPIFYDILFTILRERSRNEFDGGKMRTYRKRRSFAVFGFLLLFALLFTNLFGVRYQMPSAAEEQEELTISDPFGGFETRYEAEEGAVVHARIGDYGDSHSGTGFVGEIDYADSSVTITVSVEEDGEYDMLLAYAIGRTFPAGTFRIYNDEGYYTQVRCDKRYDWGVFRRDAVVQCKISLHAGENHIGIYKGAGNVQLDFICLGTRTGDYVQAGEEPTGPAVPEGFTRYEAENGIIVNASAKGRAFAMEYGSNYSGGGFVGNLNGVDYYVDIPVKVAESGTYELNLRYASGSQVVPMFKVCAGVYGTDKYLYSYGTVLLPVCNGWGEFSEEGVASTQIALQAGQSFVRIVPSFDYAELDCIEIGARIGDYYQGIDEFTAQTAGGNNEFDDGFFNEDGGDGYIRKSDSHLTLWLNLSATAVVAIAAIVITTTILIRRKKHEKNH